MIDISTEHLIPIRDVPHRLPSRPTGRRVHISAVYRWIQRGVHGVHLEAIRIGGSAYTSREALQRFAEGLSQKSHFSSTTSTVTSATRRGQIERADRELKALLYNGRVGEESGSPPCKPLAAINAAFSRDITQT